MKKTRLKRNITWKFHHPALTARSKKIKISQRLYGSKVDISFFAPWEGLKDLVGILISHSDETIEIKTIIKGKEAKNPVSVDRKLIAMIRPHIDF